MHVVLIHLKHLFTCKLCGHHVILVCFESSKLKLPAPVRWTAPTVHMHLAPSVVEAFPSTDTRKLNINRGISIIKEGWVVVANDL